MVRQITAVVGIRKFHSECQAVIKFLLFTPCHGGRSFVMVFIITDIRSSSKPSRIAVLCILAGIHDRLHAFNTQKVQSKVEEKIGYPQNNVITSRRINKKL